MDDVEPDFVAKPITSYDMEPVAEEDMEPVAEDELIFYSEPHSIEGFMDEAMPDESE